MPGKAFTRMGDGVVSSSSQQQVGTQGMIFDAYAVSRNANSLYQMTIQGTALALGVYFPCLFFCTICLRRRGGSTKLPPDLPCIA